MYQPTINEPCERRCNECTIQNLCDVETKKQVTNERGQTVQN